MISSKNSGEEWNALAEPRNGRTKNSFPFFEKRREEETSLTEMETNEIDEDVRSLAAKEREEVAGRVQKQREEVEKLMLPSDDDNECNAIVEVRTATLKRRPSLAKVTTKGCSCR